MKTFICAPLNGILCVEIEKLKNCNQKQLLKVFYKKSIIHNICSMDLEEGHIA